MPIVIYGLRCPLSGSIRYIGKSDDASRRFTAHMRGREDPNSHRTRWITKLRRQGLKPVLCILREVLDGEDWAVVERETIAKALAAGWPLTNMTVGGEGASLTPEALEAKKAIMSRPATRAKMSVSAKARWSDPAASKLAAEANRSPEKRAKLAEAARRRATPEYRAMMAARSKAAWSDPEKRAKIVAGITPEVLAKVSAASKRLWADPEKAKKALANLTYRRKNIG